MAEYPIEIALSDREGDSDRAQLAGMVMFNKGILEIEAEDGSRWIAGVLMTNLKTSRPSRERPRLVQAGDKVRGFKIVTD